MDTSRSLVALGLLASLGATPLAGQTGAARADDVALGGDTLDRAALIQAVLERNPGIAAARQAWEAARERIPQAESLDDPMARYGLAPLSIASDDVRFGQQLEVAQRLPYPGTLRLRGEIAAAEAAAAEQEVEQVRLRLATMASLLFDDYYLASRALAINAEHLRLLESFQRVATSRYAAGLAAQQEPIQAEVEAAHLLHLEVVLETERRTLAAQLNALLHRPPRAPLPPPPADPGLPPPPEETGGVDPETLSAARPELAAQRAEIAARRTAVALEKLDFHPDFEVMASYNSMWDMTEHQWMLGVGVNLPIRRQRIRAAVAAAEARLASAESELARLEDEVRAEVEVAAERLREALHIVHLYRNRVLPAARDQIAAARAGFETGAASMLALIDAERSLRTAELNHYEALADSFSRRAELDRALGRLPFAAAAPPASPPTASDETETER
jgi:outer membrane protein TolC